MARGGYLGGSTIIGFGRSGWFDPQFDCFGQSKPTKSKKVKQRKRVDPTKPIKIAGAQISPKTLSNHRLAKQRKIDRDQVLIGIARELPKKQRYRPEALKRLVVDGILLQTGAINLDHPAVAAWLNSNQKKSKKHD
jgi:hypothetical protein